MDTPDNIHVIQPDSLNKLQDTGYSFLYMLQQANPTSYTLFTNKFLLELIQKYTVSDLSSYKTLQTIKKNPQTTGNLYSSYIGFLGYFLIVRSGKNTLENFLPKYAQLISSDDTFLMEEVISIGKICQKYYSSLCNGELKLSQISDATSTNIASILQKKKINTIANKYDSDYFLDASDFGNGVSDMADSGLLNTYDPFLTGYNQLSQKGSKLNQIDIFLLLHRRKRNTKELTQYHQTLNQIDCFNDCVLGKEIIYSQGDFYQHIPKHQDSSALKNKYYPKEFELLLLGEDGYIDLSILQALEERFKNKGIPDQIAQYQNKTKVTDNNIKKQGQILTNLENTIPANYKIITVHLDVQGFDIIKFDSIDSYTIRSELSNNQHHSGEMYISSEKGTYTLTILKDNVPLSEFSITPDLNLERNGEPAIYTSIKHTLKQLLHRSIANNTSFAEAYDTINEKQKEIFFSKATLGIYRYLSSKNQGKINMSYIMNHFRTPSRYEYPNVNKQSKITTHDVIPTQQIQDVIIVKDLLGIKNTSSHQLYSISDAYNYIAHILSSTSPEVSISELFQISESDFNDWKNKAKIFNKQIKHKSLKEILEVRIQDILIIKKLEGKSTRKFKLNFLLKNSEIIGERIKKSEKIQDLVKNIIPVEMVTLEDVTYCLQIHLFYTNLKSPTVTECYNRILDFDIVLEINKNFTLASQLFGSIALLNEQNPNNKSCNSIWKNILINISSKLNSKYMSTETMIGVASLLDHHEIPVNFNEIFKNIDTQELISLFLQKHIKIPISHGVLAYFSNQIQLLCNKLNHIYYNSSLQIRQIEAQSKEYTKKIKKLKKGEEEKKSKLTQERTKINQQKNQIQNPEELAYKYRVLAREGLEAKWIEDKERFDLEKVTKKAHQTQKRFLEKQLGYQGDKLKTIQGYDSTLQQIKEYIYQISVYKGLVEGPYTSQHMFEMNQFNFLENKPLHTLIRYFKTFYEKGWIQDDENLLNIFIEKFKKINITHPEHINNHDLYNFLYEFGVIGNNANKSGVHEELKASFQGINRYIMIKNTREIRSNEEK